MSAEIVAEYDTGPIDAAMLAAYAAASGDSNPLHLDPDFARQAGFDDLIVHGMLGMALLGRLLGRLPGEHFPEAALLGFGARFVGVVPVGASLHCQARLAAEQDEESVRRLELEALDGAGRVVIAGTARIAVRTAVRAGA